MLAQLVDATLLYPLAIILFMASVELGIRVGLRNRGEPKRAEHLTQMAVSLLGLLALLLAFSLTRGLSRFETRRDLVREEANSIGSTARLALMLPEQAQKPILDLLRNYISVRIGLPPGMIRRKSSRRPQDQSIC